MRRALPAVIRKRRQILDACAGPMGEIHILPEKRLSFLKNLLCWDRVDFPAVAVLRPLTAESECADLHIGDPVAFLCPRFSPVWKTLSMFG